MARTCPLCQKSVQNLSSHLSRVHKMSGQERTYWFQQGKILRDDSQLSQNTTPQIGNGQADRCTRFQLLHPFTALVAGMTGSGKTFWVQNLLAHATQVIHPSPQRIVWSYAQWQPAYDEMLRTVTGIEFVKGIPHDIDEDWYFDQKVNNLIVIDDQMAETSNDKRIMNLFTKGSHHRNLSVIFLCQNVYFQGKIMRTLSLNAAYLVLFKNPRDKLQMMTLGKQMYPGKTEHFIQKYETAVQRPYGYLFVDLKPNTPEHCRLRTNVLPSDQTENPPKTISQYGGQSDVAQSIANYFERQSYLQPPLLKTLQNLEEQMTRILRDPSVPAELKLKDYTQLYNRYLELQQQLPTTSKVVQSPRQEVIHQPLATESGSSLSTPMSNLATPENIDSRSLTGDSGFAAPKHKTPSFLERITSKIKSPLLEASATRPSTSTGIPSTPLQTTTSFDPPSSTSSFSTPKTQSLPPEFPPTPPPSKEKRIKWISYQDVDKYKDVVFKPPRRSERLRAMIKSIPNWENY